MFSVYKFAVHGRQDYVVYDYVVDIPSTEMM